MKVEKQKLESPKQFEPFNLILSVETEEEARALYAIFNYIPNQEVLGYRNAENIKEKIECIPLLPNKVIANGVTYGHFYSPKKKY